MLFTIFDFMSLKILVTRVFITMVLLSQINSSTPVINPENKPAMALSPGASPISGSSDTSKLNVSVKDFGAIGNGIEDDTKSIQKAIDSVYQAGGGTVYFPSSTYKISIDSSTLNAITIRSNITLQGESNEKSIIKLADKQPKYSSIMAGEKPESNISNFALYDLGIDGNSSNNPILSTSDFNKEKLIMKHAIRIYIGSKIDVERCDFSNHNSINVITINQDEIPITDVSIKDNVFENIGGGTIDYDHSTIYTHGENIEIINNKFYSLNGGGTNAARTAIEIHGDEHTVKDNYINGFTNGINVTGYAKSSNNQVITDNIIENAYWGITIWSFFYKGNTTDPALSNCLIKNNQINLNIDAWDNLWGDTPSRGIFLETSSDAPLKKIDIVNNEIQFTNFSRAGRQTDNVASGISLSRNNAPDVQSDDIRIIGNKITNSLASGIYISMPISEGEITQNTITNPGRSSGNFHDDYRSGIVLGGDLESFQVKNNTLIDNQETNTLKGGIIVTGNGGNDSQISENNMSVSNGVKINLIRFTSESNKNFDVSN
jgi:Pectate lyase superfamily protein